VEAPVPEEKRHRSQLPSLTIAMANKASEPHQITRHL
jgi:hypothetical protein